jgi:hypothetical protein
LLRAAQSRRQAQHNQTESQNTDPAEGTHKKTQEISEEDEMNRAFTLEECDGRCKAGERFPDTS